MPHGQIKLTLPFYHALKSQLFTFNDAKKFQKQHSLNNSKELRKLNIQNKRI